MWWWGSPAGSIPPSPPCCWCSRGWMSPACSCRTGPTMAAGIAAPRTTAATRWPCAGGWASRSISAISRPSTGRACSSISWPSTRPGARRTRTCCATARSSSSTSWTPPANWVPDASPPATMPGWNSRAGAGGCCAAPTAARTRATSCTSWARRSWPPPCSRSATWKRANCAGSPGKAGCRPTPRRTRPASVSSASAISASSWASTCPPAKARSAIRTDSPSAATRGCSISPWASARV